MPVQFSTGVLREHLHTRKAAGLFDVSHMGQIALRPKSGRIEDAALALERRGAEIVVCEQSPSLSEIGAGLNLSPNALMALVRSASRTQSLRLDRSQIF